MPRTTTGKPHQQSPLLDKNTSQTPRHELSHEKPRPQHNHLPWIYIITVDLINLIMTAAEIALVLYLTIHHIQESRGVIAVAMLAPILLNFVGVTYFFSDKNERDLFEQIGTRRLTKDLFQVPVFGPVFTALKVLLISSGLSRRHTVEYERFEASAVRMRQAQTFFSASPEAVVQLSVLLISTSQTIDLDHILEILVVVVSVFTLAEANVYALRSDYFRLFANYKDGDWEVHETFGRKIILFLHSFSSIGSRIAASACLIASVQCFTMRETAMQMMGMMRPTISPPPPRRQRPSSSSSRDPWNNRNSIRPMMPEATPQETIESTQVLAQAIILTLLGLIIYHLVVYYIARLSRYACMKTEAPGGCYESINYGWRSAILHTGFQSKNVATQIWFYCENCAMFLIWYFVVENIGDPRLKDRTRIPMTVAFMTATVLSIFFLFAAVGAGLHRLENPFKKRDPPPISIS